MKALPKLRHLHILGLTPYTRASSIQERLVRHHLDHKAARSPTSAPSPYLLTFQTPPTYTCGRREINKLDAAQIAHLKAGGAAEFHEALRGGQTTFHGPGQLTAYLILSLQEHGLNTRTHIQLLENAVIGTCEYYSLKGFTTENTGVWVGERPHERKIASIGVHLRRYITSHGVGLNVDVDLSWFDRIVACGLVGKETTNLEREWEAMYGEGEDRRPAEGDGDSTSNLVEPVKLRKPSSVQDVASVFAENVGSRLSGLEGVVETVAEAGDQLKIDSLVEDMIK